MGVVVTGKEDVGPLLEWVWVLMGQSVWRRWGWARSIRLLVMLLIVGVRRDEVPIRRRRLRVVCW